MGDQENATNFRIITCAALRDPVGLLDRPMWMVDDLSSIYFALANGKLNRQVVGLAKVAGLDSNRDSVTSAWYSCWYSADSFGTKWKQLSHLSVFFGAGQAPRAENATELPIQRAQLSLESNHCVARSASTTARQVDLFSRTVSAPHHVDFVSLEER